MMKYFIIFILLLISKTAFSADTCYRYTAPNAYPEGNIMVYYCPNGWTHIMPENECRAVVPCEPDPEPLDPECVAGFEKVYNKIDGSLFGCMPLCPSGEIRDYWGNGEPMSTCHLDCKEEDGMMINENNQCVPLECFNERQELVILNSKPYRVCLYKCASNEERSFNKYNDYNCHKKTCPLGSHFENDVCVKDPEPEPDTCTTTIVGAVNCLKESVLESLTSLDKTSIFDQIINILTRTSENLDSVNSDNENPDNENPPLDTDNPDIDTSDLNAELIINEIEENTLDQNLFSYSAQCPQNRYLSIWSVSYDFSFERLCAALDKLSYLVLAIAFAISAYIIVRQ